MVVSRSVSVTELTPEPESDVVPQAPGTPAAAQVLLQRFAAGPVLFL